METNLESLDEVISRNRRSMAVFCPYQEVRRQCHYCAYCVHSPSEVQYSFCVIAHPLYSTGHFSNRLCGWRSLEDENGS